MRKRIFTWLGKEFIELSGEAKAAANATIEAQELFQRIDQELKAHGLSLDNTVRSRLWGRDRQSRDLGSTERVKILSGKARSASSSYIAPGHFDSSAKVALDLLAMRPSQTTAAKRIVEYDPPIAPIRFLVYDSVVVLSGVTTVLPTLAEQFDNIFPRIAGSLEGRGQLLGKSRARLVLSASQPDFGKLENALCASCNGENSTAGILFRRRLFLRGQVLRGRSHGHGVRIMATEKFKVAILDDFEKLADTVPAYKELQARADVTLLRKRLDGSENIVAALREFDAVLLMRERTFFSDKEYSQLPNLKLISQTGRTSKHLDLANATRRGIAVTGTAADNGVSTTELTVALILALLRKIPQVNARMREEAWPAIAGNTLEGKTIGVFGFGRIGSEVARVMKAFPNTRVLAYSRTLTAGARGGSRRRIACRWKLYGGNRTSSRCISIQPRKPAAASAQKNSP